MSIDRRDFLKGTAAAISGLLVGFGMQKMVLPVVGNQELLLPIKDLAGYENWAGKIYKIRSYCSGELLVSGVIEDRELTNHGGADV